MDRAGDDRTAPGPDEPGWRAAGPHLGESQLPLYGPGPAGGGMAGCDERAELRREEARFYIGEAREKLAGARSYRATRACRRCGATDALLVERRSQNTVTCARCGRFIYNAGKAETGQAPRTARTVRREVKPAQQARVLDRDHGRCVLCGSDEDLTIGHLLSLDEGAALGASEPELHDDANLAAMCEACNAGLGRRSVSPRTYAAIMFRLVQAERRRTGR